MRASPLQKESGVMKGKARISHIANKKMKYLLHICAIRLYPSIATFKIYYERKQKEGKHFMKIVNAVRYKLILRIFSCLKQDRLFVKAVENT